MFIEISDLKSPEIALYNDRAETKLYHYYEPEPGLFIAETPVVIERALAAGYEPVSVLGEEKIIAEQEALLQTFPKELPVYVCTSKVLSEIAGYRLARGLLCAMRRKRPASAEDVCKKASRVVLLEEVQNPTNVGAVFRCAAALGMDAVLLTKGCSDPLYRRASRVSMGNVFLVPWAYFDERISPSDRIVLLKEQGFYTAAMALGEHCVLLGSQDFSKHEKLAVIMGTESTGLNPETIEACDASVMIPMTGGVDSLNVAAAAAVAFWEFGKISKS